MVDALGLLECMVPSCACEANVAFGTFDNREGHCRYGRLGFFRVFD